MSNLVPTPITDKNGKQTTVHKKTSEAVATRGLPVSVAPATKAKPKILIPEGIDADEATTASEWIDNRMESNDPMYARADYAEVTEDGIVYGVNVNDDYLGEVFAGAQLEDEDDDEYRDRCREAYQENYGEASSAISDAFGADVSEAGDEQTAFEFYVTYDEGYDANTISTQWMGDRVESETKLLAFQNSYDVGSGLQDLIAQKMGYEWRSTDDEDRRYGDGSWVKSED
jgi:hypothetical protein